MKHIKFDIMLGDRFYRTMRMPLTLDVIDGYDGDMPIMLPGARDIRDLSRRGTISTQMESSRREYRGVLNRSGKLVTVFEDSILPILTKPTRRL